RQAQRTPLLGERLAAARRTIERRWGCHNLELPVSLLCGSESFAWFACHLLGDLSRFRSIYNRCVQEYRRLHGIRSRNHPVPDLIIHGIGGAKYDELTDEIMRRFYGLEAPEYLVLSATLWLPLPAFPVGLDLCKRLARELRDVHYNPQRHLDPAARADPAVA